MFYALAQLVHTASHLLNMALCHTAVIRARGQILGFDKSNIQVNGPIDTGWPGTSTRSLQIEQAGGRIVTGR